MALEQRSLEPGWRRRDGLLALLMVITVWPFIIWQLLRHNYRWTTVFSDWITFPFVLVSLSSLQLLFELAQSVWTQSRGRIDR